MAPECGVALAITVPSRDDSLLENGVNFKGHHDLGWHNLFLFIAIGM